MDIGNHSITWSEELEQYFRDIGEKSYCYSILHKNSETKFTRLTTFIDIPVIVLSSVLGTLSIGNSSVFGEKNEKDASLFIGVGSIFVSVLNTIGTYFSYSKRAENHRLCSLNYNKLYRFLSIEMSLTREERINPKDLLKITREQYERLMNDSPLLSVNIINEFKSKYKDKKYEDINKPSECNGLERIVINNKSIENTIIEIERSS
jgi:hypothetical protein